MSLIYYLFIYGTVPGTGINTGTRPGSVNKVLQGASVLACCCTLHQLVQQIIYNIIKIIINKLFYIIIVFTKIVHLSCLIIKFAYTTNVLQR